MSGNNHSGSKRILLLLFGLSILALWTNSRSIPVRRPSQQSVRRTLASSNAVDANTRSHVIRLRQGHDESFSACLLTMDDTHFLIEWLAYHYHSLPLRRLIVAVDPNSKTSPSGVFDRWRMNGMMEIDEWTDADFVKSSRQNQTGTSVHRFRQKAFNRQCLQTLKKENRTWTIMVDVDEYLSYNTYTQNSTSDIEKPGSFLEFLKEEGAKNETQLQDSPCIVMPRLRYGSVESDAEQVSNQVPHGFNGSAFQTLRFRKHGKPGKRNSYGASKTLIDVSQIDAKDITKASPHRPVRKHCPKQYLFIKPYQSPLVVRHYLGTWEQFFFRDDARHKDGMKTDKTYNESMDLDFGEDDALRPWIKGFVSDVGYDAAMELLDGVGNVSVATPVESEAAANHDGETTTSN